jgi:hypothetical protein
MKIRILLNVLCSMTALSLVMGAATAAEYGSQEHEHSQKSSNKKAVGLVKEVIKGTRQYRDVQLAESHGWTSTENCVSGPDEGAMGIHYANFPLVVDDELDPQRPEALIYEKKNGKLRLVGVEFIMLYDVWHAEKPLDMPPVLMGQLFHYNGSPNRYGLPPFYALHVWAFKDNPHGVYVNWHPKVTCDEYAGES